MLTFLEIARTGLAAVLLHPQRSAVTVAALVAVLLPFAAGLGLSRGLRDEAEGAVSAGADLYVGGEQFGRPAPVPLAVADDVRRIPGVTAVTPRVVGRIELGKDRIAAVLVGVPPEDFPAELECFDGRPHRRGKRNELVVGSDLARRLDLHVGDLLPPFYHNRGGERVSEIVGIFRSDTSAAQARLIVTSPETAAHIFDQPGLVTDLLVRCRPGYADEVRRAILHDVAFAGPARPRVLTRDDLAEQAPRDLLRREGAFTLFSVLAFAVGVLAVLVTSGVGLSERRREVGILKATGWQTDQLLLRSLTESFVLSLLGWSLAVLLAFTWLRGFNGWWIAGVFLPDAGLAPNFRVPFRLTPVPALLALLIAFVVVMSGSLWSTWRAAVAPPREAMR